MSAKNEAKKSKKIPARELELTNSTRAVWLVKVPNYISEVWKNATPSSDLGMMKITSNPKKVDVTFTLSDELAKQQSEKLGLEVPREHRVVMQDPSRQSLSVFSEDSATDQILAEGRVTQKADIQPLSTTAYMKLKQHQIIEAGKTKFQAVQLDKTPVNSYKPKSRHAEYEKPKQPDKRVRVSKQEVLDLIFAAFESHQYYNFKDLVHKTKQPHSYLKEILREVCMYNTKPPHKNMWELKPEYRTHHSRDKPTSSS